MSGASAYDDRLVTGEFDIADPDDQRRIRLLADSLLASDQAPDDLARAARADDVSIDLALAYKLALSRHDVLVSGWAGRVAVVFAMWGEQRRLRPRDGDNPTGEDSLHVKLDQLDWLFDGTDVDWMLIPVDDGDPDDSATVAAGRAALHGSGERVTVLPEDADLAVARIVPGRIARGAERFKASIKARKSPP